MIRPRSRARRGPVFCREYVAWMHETFGCLVAGRLSGCGGPLALHHVRHQVHPDGRREFTSKNDFRSLILCERHHLHSAGPHAIHALTAPGAWEEFFGVDIEAEICRYNDLWRAAGGKVIP